MQLQALLSDGALLLFSISGLVATAVAIARDTRAQYAEHADLAELRLDN